MLNSFFSKLMQRAKPPAAEAAQVKSAELSVVKAPASRYETLKQQGTNMLDLGKLEEAARLFEEALQENPSAEAYLNAGFANLELNRLDAAKAHLEKAAELNPDSFDAHLLCAMVAAIQSNRQTALVTIRSALKIKPTAPEAVAILYKLLALESDFEGIEAHATLHNDTSKYEGGIHVSLANTLLSISSEGQMRTGLLNRAADHLHQALLLNPGDVHALLAHGQLLSAQDDKEGALQCYKKAIACDTTFAPAHVALASAYVTAGNTDLAIKAAKNAVETDPKNVAAYILLGNISKDRFDHEDAIGYYKKILDIQPDLPEVLINLGAVYSDSDQDLLAIDSVQQAVKLRKTSPEAHFALGNIYSSRALFSEAADCYRIAIQLRPGYVNARCNLASALLGLGHNEQALDIYQSVVRDAPCNLVSLQNVAFCLSFGVGSTPAEYLTNAKRFGAVVSASARPFINWVQKPLRDRPLKVGMVSGDLHAHPVGRFLESVLTYFDLEKTEIHLFSNRTHADELQASLKSRVSHWTSIAGLTDEAAATVVHDAELDLLIDLSGYTDRNRCALFAWRPAPVQAAWLGYWASTGVAEIDYILTDRHSVLPEHHCHFSEQVWYMDSARLCFTPPSKTYTMLPSACPAVKRGRLTFGCFQPIRKLNQRVLNLWGQIHRLLPNAHFRLQATGYTDPKIRAEALERLEIAGVAVSSVTLLDSVPSSEYLLAHGEVDIILDSFPYPGGTTTCDALWMGVPTVTLAGNTMLSRQGVSLLTYAGLADWVAQTEDEYVAIAVQKASDLKQLSQLRAVLRQQVFKSSLFNAPEFASGLGNTFRGMVLHKLPHLGVEHSAGEVV